MGRPERSRHLSIIPLLLTGGLLVGVLVVLFTAGGRDGAIAPATATGGGLLALLPAAFLAGLLSFIAPCTLPLLPAYFAYTFQARGQRVTLMTVAFFWGLATTLTLLGATTTALSRLLNLYARQLAVVGGIIVIVFGVMSLSGLGFTGIRFGGRPAATLAGSYIYGATFALGWSTCIGPILGAILTLLAAQGSSVAEGALLAFVYALGLGSPLIVIASFFDRLGTGSRFWRLLKGRGWTVTIARRTVHLHSTGIASGLLLIGMGTLLASGRMAEITQLAAASDLSLWVIETEEHVRDWFRLP